MATFDDYNLVIEQKLANTSEVFYDEEMKKTEINNTLRELTSEYNLPELKKRSTITFDANGIASIPSDYKEMIKLWDEDANGIQTNEFQYLPEDEFDRYSSTASYIWTVDYDVSDDTRKIYVKPITAGTLDIRYYQLLDPLTGNNDESGLSSVWNEAIALGAVFRLLNNAGRYEEAGVFNQAYIDKRAELFLRVKDEGGIKQNRRLKPAYERKSQLGITGGYIYYNRN